VEEKEERVVEKVEEGAGVQVGVALHLAGEEGLPRPAAEQAAQPTVGRVQLLRRGLRFQIKAPAGPANEALVAHRDLAPNSLHIVVLHG